MDTMIRGEVRTEHLRIAGKKVDTGNRLEVRFPWDNRLVGTVPPRPSGSRTTTSPG
jgi:phosphonoacetaldehyde dehydrogenase